MPQGEPDIAAAGQIPALDLHSPVRRESRSALELSRVLRQTQEFVEQRSPDRWHSGHNHEEFAHQAGFGLRTGLMNWPYHGRGRGNNQRDNQLRHAEQAGLSSDGDP